MDELHNYFVKKFHKWPWKATGELYTIKMLYFPRKSLWNDLPDWTLYHTCLLWLLLCPAYLFHKYNIEWICLTSFCFPSRQTSSRCVQSITDNNTKYEYIYFCLKYSSLEKGVKLLPRVSLYCPLPDWDDGTSSVAPRLLSGHHPSVLPGVITTLRKSQGLKKQSEI